MALRPTPEQPEGITAGWLTEALRSSGIITESAVYGIARMPLEAAGFTGQVARFQIRYAVGDGGGPPSIILKLPPIDPQTRAFGCLLRLYEREARFYREIGPQAGLRTPRCYYSDIDENGLSILLLEDLAPAQPGDQLRGWSAERAATAVQHVAGLHARWWGRPALERFDWMPSADDPAAVAVALRVYDHAWGPFLDRFGDRLSAHMKRVGERLGANIAALLAGFAAPPRTLIHGDYRMDNLLFGPEPGSLAAIDWQLSCKGQGIFDMAYFMSQSMPPELRQVIERELLELYCRTLEEKEVGGVSREACFEGYRKGVLYGLVYPVIVGGTLVAADSHAVEVVRTVTDRALRAIEDLGAEDCLA